jgi:hypothetical protein
MASKDALIYASRERYKNERRMTREQCEVIKDNMQEEFDTTFDINYIGRKHYTLDVFPDGGKPYQVLIEAETLTALYWSMVDARELIRYVVQNFNSIKGSK